MNIFWEVMIREMRAERAELDHRRHFTPEKKPIDLTRAVIADFTEIHQPEDLEVVAARSASNMAAAAEADLFEVG